ncbi:MAG: DNA-binding transcriptional LysR family regulator [Verrucomicrobiales bacterium]|jgi:DNA-binding transcriptional LysR family regulator
MSGVKAIAPTATQLEYLVAALEHGSWTTAAEELHVSTSAFAQGIAELERRLDLRLFDKEGRCRVPTAEAEVAARHAIRVLGELGSLGRWAAQARSGEVGQIRAGMIDTAAVHHFGDALVRFRTMHPDLAVRLTVLPSQQLHEQLRIGELDVVIAVAPADTDGLQTRELVAEPLYVYAPAGSTIGAPPMWGPWVYFPADSRTRALVAEAMGTLGAPFDVVAESSQPAVLREMVRLGMGWTVLPTVDAEREPHALKRAVVEPVAERVLTLARRSDRTPSTALDRFIAMLVSEATIRYREA